MTRIFDALRKAESAKPHAAGPAAVTPLPAPVPHATGGARAAAAARASATPGAYRAALPLIGAMGVSDEVTREMSALRVSLEALLGSSDTRRIMFVAPQGGEGTSTVALQFATVLAMDPSLRVLVIDAHARRPVFHVDGAARAVVADPRVAGEGYQPGAAPSTNLFVVPVPDEIVESGIYRPAELRAVLDAATAGFDWVVLDGAPVLESPDSAALAALADATLMVVQAGRSKRPVISRSSDLLRKSGARIVGSVLNRRVLEIPEFIYRRI